MLPSGEDTTGYSDAQGWQICRTLPQGFILDRSDGTARRQYDDRQRPGKVAHVRLAFKGTTVVGVEDGCRAGDSAIRVQEPVDPVEILFKYAPRTLLSPPFSLVHLLPQLHPNSSSGSV